MNAYEWKQTAFGAAVDRGLYSLASRIDEVNAAEFSGGIPWYIIRAIANRQQQLTPEQIEQPKPKPKRKSKLLRILCRLLK